MTTSRRKFLQVLGSAAAVSAMTLPSRRSMAEVTRTQSDEFFVFIFASGGWDVTLWADPRNEARGIIHPASTENTDTSQVRLWKNAPLGGNVAAGGGSGASTFELVRPRNSNLVFGPGIGLLAEMPERITVVNGMAMNTVAHPDGATFSATGRHPQGGRVAAPSVDTVLANELGTEMLLPTVSLRFPSAYVGENLDRRVVPLSIDSVGAISKSLARDPHYDLDPDRDRVTAMLSEEARDLAHRASYPDVLDGLSLQFDGLSRMLGSKLGDTFSADGLRKLHPELNYKTRFAGGPSVNAAFAVEAFKRNIVRCVSFAVGSFDTHANNYRQHAQNQQELFDMVATLVRTLDATPHPTRTGAKLSEHTHLMVISEFCRTPQINIGMGRDHYPNNSSLIVSPRFKTNFVYGKTDTDQLLPSPVKHFIDGQRAISPPDVLATFVSAFGVDPRKYMRDGEVVPELLVNAKASPEPRRA